MENCYSGINLPTQISEVCGGEYISTQCVQTPTDITPLDISAGDSQAEINTAITNAILHKEEQIVSITEDVQSYVERKIFRGSFLDSVITNTIEDTINDVAINKVSTGVYELTSSAFTESTIINITPNSVAAGYEEVTISYLYTNATLGSIVFKVRNNGTLVDLLESPIKIEI